MAFFGESVTHGFVLNPLLGFHVCQPSLTAGPANNCLPPPQTSGINKHRELRGAGWWEGAFFAKPQPILDDVGEYKYNYFVNLSISLLLNVTISFGLDPQQVILSQDF